MFLRNCWYVIAWDHEIPAADAPTLFARTVLGESILVYRRHDGALAALANRCCHRLAPLSCGRREGDDIRCGYHGLRFAPDGRCVEIPGSSHIPDKARVRHYPLALRHRWVFVWMGDPALADESLLPDNQACDHPDWRYHPGYLHYATPQLLICDNLLDFSHLSYVHEKTLGGAFDIASTRPKVERIAQGVRVRRDVPAVAASPFWKSLQDFPTLVDRWFLYDFVLPGTLLMETGGRPIGQAEDDERGTIRFRSCQTVTPETTTTSHYFFMQAHAAHITDPAVTDKVFLGLLDAFEEDRDIITAQFDAIRQGPEQPMLPLGMDAALVQFRRLLDERLRQEAGAADVLEPA